MNAAKWHLSHKHKRGPHPRVEPAFAGNKGRALNSVRNLARVITEEGRFRRKPAEKANS